MGRTASPRKPTPASRSLSSRLAADSTPAAPSPLRSLAPSLDPSPSASPVPPAKSSKSPAMPAQKRAFEDLADPATPKLKTAKKKPRRKDRKGKAVEPPAAVTNPAPADDELEEGEVVEGDFSDLFVFDTTPAAVSSANAFVGGPAPSPTKQTTTEEGSKDLMLLEDEPKKEDAGVAEADKEDEQQDEDEVMRIFAKEVAMSDDDDDSDDDSEEDELGEPEGLMLYDDEEGLQEAIKSKIVDDSSAPVTGRYYKEADLTKSCVLCGESGHTSRDCTHSQCFVCGQIDAEHEARTCPVSLVCSACGSRGHFARDCDIASNAIRSYGSQRCSLCSSTKHTAVNCPSLWRVYDTSGPKPPKRKIVCACANCGSTKDHFLDDCLLPRGHPMRYADPSAFNRAALGASASSLPSYSAGPSSSRRRNGKPAPSSNRRDDYEYDYDEPADDDWFASRARGGGDGKARSRSTGGTSSGGGRNSARGGGGGGGSAKRGNHIHFGGLSDESRDRFQPPPHRDSPAYRDRDGGYDSPRASDNWRSMYGDGGASGAGGSERKRNGTGNGKGNGNGGGYRTSDRSDRRGGPSPSLLDRMGGGGAGGNGNGGGGSGRKGPRYLGGYV
ncbi:hypothetical protein JCM1841_003936 [Sporobolomyces salmonicolor]